MGEGCQTRRRRESTVPFRKHPGTKILEKEGKTDPSQSKPKGGKTERVRPVDSPIPSALFLCPPALAPEQEAYPLRSWLRGHCSFRGCWSLPVAFQTVWAFPDPFILAASEGGQPSPWRAELFRTP